MTTDGFIPVRITTPADPDAWKDKREPLFYVDDVEYTIPVKVPGSVSLEAMERFRQYGDAAASPWLMELVLGEDGYAALRRSGVEKEDLAKIGKVVRDRVFGGLEDEPGK
jgi:hypothetical protein